MIPIAVGWEKTALEEKEAAAVMPDFYTPRTYRDCVLDVLEESISVNKETYERLYREDPEMREWLRDLMKEDFEKAEARGEIKGAIRLYSDEMHLMPTEIIKKIMVRFNLKQDVAEKYVEETLKLEMA